MPDGSLLEQIQTLKTALESVVSLSGEPAQGDSSGSNMSGAASLVASSPTAQFSDLQALLTQRLSGILEFDTGAVTQITSTLGNIGGEITPTAAIEGFSSSITQVSTAFNGGFLGQIQSIVDAIGSISEKMPENSSGVFKALLEQILEILTSLNGPEAEKITGWVKSLNGLHATVMPMIEDIQNNPNPADVLVKIMEKSLSSILELFGYERVEKMLLFLDDFPGKIISHDALSAVNAASTCATGAFNEIVAAANGPREELITKAEAGALALWELKQTIRPVLGSVQSLTQASIFQPNALENYLTEKLKGALSVEQSDLQKIDDPFKALFDRIDASIEKIDLSFVRDDILGFFQDLQDTINSVNVSSIGNTLQDQLDKVTDGVQTLQQEVASLIEQVKQFFDGLSDQYRELIGNIGTFKADGTFEYNFEPQLRNLLMSAQTAISGDPNNPSAPSLTGTINEFGTTIDQFFSTLTGYLEPVEDQIDTALATSVTAIEDFSGFLQGLNMPDLIEQLRAKVEEVLDQLVPIDFDLVIDPVVSEIEEGKSKLADIDTSTLNSMLKEALKVALDVVISIDFTASISKSLEDEFAAIKAVPQQAIEQLQKRYEAALAFLDELKPEKLLEALFAAFDVIVNAISSLDAVVLLAPLDALHEQYLKQPLQQIKPSTILEPASEAFQRSVSCFDSISGDVLISPVNDLLNEMKTSIGDFDLTGPLDDLVGRIETIKQKVRDLRPSELLTPIVSDFAKLEEQLDRFKPSIIFAPITDLAAPLLGFLENIQEQTIETLYNLFRAPLQLLERLEPTALINGIHAQIDRVIDFLKSINVSAFYNQLKGQYFDVKVALGTDDTNYHSTAILRGVNPQMYLGEIVATHTALIEALEGLKSNIQSPNMDALYNQVKEKALSMLPPYARELLDPEAFKRLMRLADPSRFLEELDARFDAIKNKLIPIRPQDIAEQLDTTYDTVLNLVDGLNIEGSLNQVKDSINNLKGIVNTIRIDFVAADIDKALDDFKQMVVALDPVRFADDLDAVHHQVELAVDAVLPSELLSGLNDTLDAAKGIIERVNPRETLEPPLLEAWESILGVLDDIDFTIILSPLVDKITELETEFKSGLGRTESAFDQMLGAAKGALGSGGTQVTVGVSG